MPEQQYNQVALRDLIPSGWTRAQSLAAEEQARRDIVHPTDPTHPALAPVRLTKGWVRRILGKADPEEKALEDYFKLHTSEAVKKKYRGLDSPLARAQYMLDEHKRAPHIGNKLVDSLPRSVVPTSFISEQELRDLGFQDSLVAVPERGQSKLTTLRHPTSNMHIHRHNKDWIYHVDSWPSMQMQRERANKTGDKVNYATGVQHALFEGVPGYYNYALNTILGTPTFAQLARNPNVKTHPLRAIAGLTAAIGGPAALAAALSDEKAVAAKHTAGLVGGGIGGLLASRGLRNTLFTPAAANDSRLRFLTDTLGMLGGAYAGHRLTRKKKDKNDE
jgi:hypothetical protein